LRITQLKISEVEEKKDFHINELPAKLQGANVKLVSLADSPNKVNIIVTLTDHTVFKQVKQSVLQEKVIIDARGIWEKD